MDLSNGDQMVVVVPNPLVDTLPMAFPNQSRKEKKQIRFLLSDNQFRRSAAVTWLKEKGTSNTAKRLEAILIKNGLPNDVKRDLVEVLLHLSHRHLDFIQTREGEFRRKLALASGLPAFRRRAIA